MKCKCPLSMIPANWGPTILRVVAGGMMLTHGVPKLMNFGGTIEFMAGMGIPSFVAVLVILIESFAALALVLGFKTKCVAKLLFGLSIGLIFFHQGSMDGVVLYAAAFASLAITGGGALSLCGKCCKKSCDAKK